MWQTVGAFGQAAAGPAIVYHGGPLSLTTSTEVWGIGMDKAPSKGHTGTPCTAMLALFFRGPFTVTAASKGVNIWRELAGGCVAPAAQSICGWF